MKIAANSFTDESFLNNLTPNIYLFLFVRKGYNDMFWAYFDHVQILQKMCRKVFEGQMHPENNEEYIHFNLQQRNSQSCSNMFTGA